MNNNKEKTAEKKAQTGSGLNKGLFEDVLNNDNLRKKKANATQEKNSQTNSAKTKENKTEPKIPTHTISNFFKSEMTQFVSGLVFFILGVFLFISFLSFFFTGAEDQTFLENLPVSQLSDVKTSLTNWAGFFGAYLADLLINRWVGISSFFISFIVIATGLKLMKVKNITLSRVYLYSVVLMVWFSLFFGFFFISGYESSYLYLGGKHGYYITLLLKANIGWFGTFLTITGLFIIIASFLYNPTIEYVRKAFNIELPRISFFKSLFTRENKEEIKEEIIDENEAFKIRPEVKITTEEIQEEEESDIEEEYNVNDISIEDITEDIIPSGFEVVDIENQQKMNEGWIEPEPVVSINDLYSRRFGVAAPVVNQPLNNVDADDNYNPEIDKYIDNDDSVPLNTEIISEEYEVAEESWQQVEEINNEKSVSEEDLEMQQSTYSAELPKTTTIEAQSQEPDHNEAEFKVETGEKDEILDNPEDQLGEYDPTLDLSNYKFPTFNLLNKYEGQERIVDEEEQSANKRRIEDTLNNYGIEIQSIVATVGPTITLYEIIPKQGVRISKIRNLEDDIALSLAALGIRIIAPIPGKGTVGIEVPNKDPQMVSMYSVIASRKFQDCKFELPVALGKTITNDVFILDLAKMPHVLVAGATGQGKSVGLNAILTSLLYKKHPAQLKFVLIDPKKVEFNIYSHIERHFLAKLPDEEDAIITDVTKVVATLNSICKEMDERYDLLKAASTRNIKEYNAKFQARRLNPEKGHRYMPYIVVVVDEFGDLIMTAGKEVELPIARIAQLARAVGIHMIIATQRPSTNIITGIIKANFPARIAFRVSSMIDSRTILDSPGANQLIGRGDMLFSQGSDMVRVQCAFVDTPEVEHISEFIGQQVGYPTAFLLPEYVAEGSDDNGVNDIDLRNRDTMFEDAARMVVASQQGSTSMIQRKFAIGYNRAGRIMDQLEAAGIVGPFEGSKARQVLVIDDMHLDNILSNLRS